MLLVPLLVAMLVRLNRQYEREQAELDQDVAATISAPVPANHVSVVLVDKLDGAAARALHVARTLRTDRTEAVHFAIDDHRVERLADAWAASAPENIDLRIVDTPERAARQYVYDLVADGRTQVSVLVPRLLHRKRWHRLLHDETAEELVDSLSKLPNVNVTIVPFHLGGDPVVVMAPAPVNGNGRAHHAKRTVEAPLPERADGTQPIGGLEWRRPCTVVGRVEELVVETVSGAPSLVAVLDDGSGRLSLQFLGRPKVPGLQLGAKVKASGMAAAHRGRLTIVNPIYEFVAPPPEHVVSPVTHE
jgi:hypothetical protein